MKAKLTILKLLQSSVVKKHGQTEYVVTMVYILATDKNIGEGAKAENCKNCAF